MRYLTTKIILFIGFLLIVYSCSTTKKVPEGEFLLTKNKFEFDGKEKPFKSELQDYVKQRPNSKFLQIIPFQLLLYNMNPAELDTVFEEYYDLTQKKRTQESLDSLFLKNGLEKYVGRNFWLKRFIYNSGKPPVIIDTAMSAFSETNLEGFYFDKGYFDAHVQSSHNLDSSSKKGQVNYKINPGEASFINSYKTQITDTIVKGIYERTIERSNVKSGNRYDMDDFVAEKDRIVEMMRNRGYYKFNDLGNDVEFTADTTHSDKALDVTLLIPAEKKSDSTHLNKIFKRYRYNQIHIYPDSGPVPSGQPKPEYFDTIYEGYHLHYVNPEMKHRPKFFTDAMVVREKGLYRYDSEVQTKRNILKREGVNLVAFTDSVALDSLLNVKIYITPKKKYDLFYGADLSWSEFMNFGVSPRVTLLARNLFRGGENLETTFRGTLGNVNEKFSDDGTFFNAFEMSFNTALKFPYLVFPFNLDGVFPKRYFKQTDLRLGAGVQRNIGLGRVTYSTGMDYNISFRDTHEHRLSIFNTEFITNLEKEKYFDVFVADRGIRDNMFGQYFIYDENVGIQYNANLISDDEVINLLLNDVGFLNSLDEETGARDLSVFANMYFRKQTITQDVLISSMIYQYNYDESKRTRVKHPWFFRGRIELAGNVPALLDNAFGFEKTQMASGKESGMLFNVPYSQFIKVDLDVRKYFNLSPKSSIATRAFVGLIEPYGNADFIPFSRSYTAGGANDMRAWVAATLGPADIPRFDGGEDIFAISNMKLLLSAEYRFNITGIFNGAFFVDAGNIWGTDKDYEPSLFQFKDFYKEMGVGSGLGLRLDLTYFLIRADFAYKIHDPSFEEGNRWRFNDFNILRPRLAFGINYPF
ncbi:translocation and assembly module lipoprotein TamL [Moheibacter sediminis]|uniref:Surface antigen n=1 Tax=Moheibacter sediminis TaxID=1434700 RepID=A0A1W2BS82_9FLAO|nr:BamA/TamA family outer membrane protein [Moheibacter sediminis]SMC75803.1 Surface antigen [Moheibacter sediminis]